MGGRLSFFEPTPRPSVALAAAASGRSRDADCLGSTAVDGYVVRHHARLASKADGLSACERLHKKGSPHVGHWQTVQRPHLPRWWHRRTAGPEVSLGMQGAPPKGGGQSR